MKTERDIFTECGLPGFPNLSAIRERLIFSADTTAIEFWEVDFDGFAKSVLETVKRTAKCSENQAEVLAKQCLLVANRRRKTEAS